jgi:RNA polymerase sigma factor (sigma-70 family)
VSEGLTDLLRRCQDGQPSAVSALVTRFQPWALDLACAFVPDDGLAEDAVQEAFVAALTRLGDLRDPVAFPGWFRQIIRTHASRITRKRREVLLPAAPEPVGSFPSPSVALERGEIRELVRKALAGLPPAGRETAKLFYLDEHSCGEVADLLQVPTGTVKRRLHDARKRLRGMLLGHIGEEGAKSRGAPDKGNPSTDGRLPL